MNVYQLGFSPPLRPEIKTLLFLVNNNNNTKVLNNNIIKQQCCHVAFDNGWLAVTPGQQIINKGAHQEQ